MNKEIEFRAWDKKRLVMLEVTCIDFERKVVYGYITRHKNILDHPQMIYQNFNDVELMRYAEIIDKNCKNVYEHDYIKHSQGIDRVHFENGCWCIGFWTPGLLHDNDPYQIEVVGNKYETPILGEK